MAHVKLKVKPSHETAAIKWPSHETTNNSILMMVKFDMHTVQHPRHFILQIDYETQSSPQQRMPDEKGPL